MKQDHPRSWRETALPALPASVTDNPFDAPIAAFPLSPPIRRGTWFDGAIDFRDPEGEALTKEVIALTAAVRTRQRKRRPLDEINHYRIIRGILANGLRCHYHRRPAWVACLLKAESYRDGPVWLSGKALSRSIRVIEETGLLIFSIGEHGTASTYRISEKCREIAEGLGITSSRLTLRLPPERLVRLHEGNSETNLIAFEPDDNTRRWTVLLDAYNAFLAQQDIALPMSHDEEAIWVAHRNGERSKDKPPLYRPELFQTDLHRTFNNGSFDEGGRLYGGWWINTPKALRPKITINGKPTVELDYSGCAVRMLYHERGIDYRDDPYQLEALAAHEVEAGLKIGHYRKGVKALMQALFNGNRDGRPELARIDGFTFKPAFGRPEVRRMIEEKHAPIADTFGTGAGLRLQRRDGDLALAIITDLREQGIVALPIHDSFLTTEDDRSKLLAIMNREYHNMFGFYPIIR